MHSVTGDRIGITPERTAEVLGRELGTEYQVETGGGNSVLVRRGFLGRARVTVLERTGATVFEVRGQRPSLPLLMLTARIVNERGIARRVAGLIGQSEELGARR